MVKQILRNTAPLYGRQTSYTLYSVFGERERYSFIVRAQENMQRCVREGSA